VENESYEDDLRQGSLNCGYGQGPALHALNPISENFWICR